MRGFAILKKLPAIVTACLVLAFAARCVPAQKAAAPVFSSDGRAERIPNLDALKKELREYHDCTCTCGCYAHDVEGQADRAIEFLRKRAARQNSKEKLALILDIDETTLSTYPEMMQTGFAYNPAVFEAWVQAATGKAIPGTLRVFKEAQRLGVSIFFVTGRSETERTATERNLRAEGFDSWKLLFMRPAEHGSQTIGDYKAVIRGQIVAAGYTLALNVGDQWSDLKGKPEAEFSVKYPDPFYFIP
jgi:acid phosphatase